MALAHRAKNTYAALPFISTWKTDNLSTGSSTNTQVKLPLVSTGTYKFTVNWGDGSSNVITTWNQAQVTHTYAAIGTYTITITGFIKGWEFNNTGDRLKIMTLVQWGCLRLGNAMPTGFVGNRGFFDGCENITYTTTSDILNLKGTTNIMSLFRRNYSATKINNIEKLDVSKVTSAVAMFYQSINWNGDVSYFNTSNITDMYLMLCGGASVFPHGSFTNMGNPDIGNWDTSKVTDMRFLFGSQYKFNHNIGNWDVSNVRLMGSMFQINPTPANAVTGRGLFNNGGSNSIKNWNTSNVISMNNTFTGQPDFNQEIGLWNVSNVTDMANMFFVGTNSLLPNGISGVFNNAGSSSIANWNISSLTSLNGAFTNQVQFNQPIGSWNTSTINNMNGTFQNASGFNQNIGNWNVSLVTNFGNFMLNKTNLNYSAANYDALLIGWASRPVKPNLSISFSTIKRTAASTAAKTILTSAPNNWTIVDGGI